MVTLYALVALFGALTLLNLLLVFGIIRRLRSRPASTIVRVAAKTGTVWRAADTTSHTPTIDTTISATPSRNRMSAQNARGLDRSAE